MKNIQTKINNIPFLISLIVLLTSVGCSDVPYTGPVLSVNNVDRYLDTIGEDTVCLEDGFDVVCIKLLPAEDTPDDSIPVVRVHPTGLNYIFYYEDNPLLRAEREMDTTQIVQELIDAGRVQLPADTDYQGTGNNTTGPWMIQIYYPESFPEADRGETLATSGLNIRVVAGKSIPTNRRNDLEIQNFRQHSGRSALFSVKTDASEITIQVDGLVPNRRATFRINADDVEPNGGSNTLELKPL